ncbi:glucoamylase [Nakamurella panacisegetis]|uniref:Glucoamylase n=1 Tax=Nakamurella panacisegetis TaxID=1090615 RepID=A0A1H0PR71_9ACTN|nr:hypothetical protein [Nakamurella panacisegetis]SDP07637.1 glucoamylase [Nakamurella panacisegetis]
MRLSLKPAAAALLAATLALTACTSSSGTSPNPSSRASISAPSSGAGTTTSVTASGTAKSSTSAGRNTKPTALPSGVTAQTLPTSVANVVDKRKNVAITSCAAVSGGWGAKGTAVNRSPKPVTYTITIFFTTTQATTLASAATKVTVKSGQTAKWSASAKLKAPRTMLCVLRGVG